jgi:hypothetical protein
VNIRKLASKIKVKSSCSFPRTNGDDNDVDLTSLNGIQGRRLEFGSWKTGSSSRIAEVQYFTEEQI